SSSSSYSVSSSTGDIAIGSSASSNFTVDAGTQTSPDPTLTFAMDTPNANFGNFSAATTTTSSATFSVINYTSYGYVVQLVGAPPTNGGNEITPMTTTGPSQPGIEQFGVNLVANTSPISFGANPNNGTPPNNFGFGTVATDYSTPNQFRFVSGETVASAPKSSGKTIYTLSYIVNVSSLTPAGVYKSDQTLVVTGTY
ncbi:MAG: hypothetical protein WBK76_00325, partial [Candidatus Saccharimonadales bacterium]